MYDAELMCQVQFWGTRVGQVYDLNKHPRVGQIYTVYIYVQIKGFRVRVIYMLLTWSY